MTGYDVIGDVHGHADRLTGLLHSMGYRERAGAWRHRDRQAIFVGDVIDRGPQQLDAIGIVRDMVEAGAAQITLGNHEFNAVAYATEKPATDTEPAGHYRSHGPKNRKQHRAFLEAVGFDSPVHRELVRWFTTIPLWLDLGGLRVVHAYWSEHDMDVVRGYGGPGDTLTDQLVIDGSTRGHDAYAAIERLVKGPEIRLPDGRSFLDKGRHRRQNVRLRWWDDSAIRWSDLLPAGTTIFDADGSEIPGLPDDPIPPVDRCRYDGGVPVIFGHYWFDEPLRVENPMALCVDYSAGAGKQLVAYRFDGEPELTAANLVRF